MGASGAGGAVVWKDGESETLLPEAGWAHLGKGAISSDGERLVLMVSETGALETGAERGWQMFKKVDSEWRPTGPVATIDWMSQPPTAVDDEGSRAWTAVHQSTSENRTVLLSHEFATGAWEEWLPLERLPDDLGSYYIAAVMLTE